MKMKKICEKPRKFLEHSDRCRITLYKTFHNRNIKHNNQHEDININVCCIHVGSISYFCYVGVFKTRLNID